MIGKSNVESRLKTTIFNMTTITLTEKELKLIEKALLNRKLGKAEELLWFSIQEKIEKAKKKS